MPLSCFSKEILDYTRACEHLIGESIKRNSQLNHFSKQELELVKYYTSEVGRLLRGSMSRNGGQLTKRTYEGVAPKNGPAVY